jgi:hypothetical protein
MAISSGRTFECRSRVTDRRLTAEQQQLRALERPSNNAAVGAELVDDPLVECCKFIHGVEG